MSNLTYKLNPMPAPIPQEKLDRLATAFATCSRQKTLQTQK